MPESNSFTQARYYFRFNVPHSIKALIKRGAEECFFLILPEDTTENTDHRHNGSIDENKIRSTVKVGFWVAVAIAATLAAGQLQ